MAAAKRPMKVGNGDGKSREFGGPLTEKTKLERLARCEELLHKCMPHGVICRTLAAEWGVTPRTVQNYITVVYETWMENAKAEAPYRREKAREMMLQAAHECFRLGETASGVRALAEYARYVGAVEAEQAKLEITGAISVTDSVPSDAVRKRIEELAAKRSAK